jgi:hypothetical protein
MGCGASKGESKEAGADEIEFKRVGVYTVDEFFEKCKSLLT